MSRSRMLSMLLAAGLLYVMPVFAQICEPQINTSSLLDSVSADAGFVYIGKMYARCLPMPAKKSRTNYEYNPYDGGKLSATLKTSNGQAINTFVWYGDQVLSIWELTRYEVVGGREAASPTLITRSRSGTDASMTSTSSGCKRTNTR